MTVQEIAQRHSSNKPHEASTPAYIICGLLPDPHSWQRWYWGQPNTMRRVQKAWIKKIEPQAWFAWEHDDLMYCNAS